MGRPRLPSAVHKARTGTNKTRGRRELPPDEPQPDVAPGDVKPPAGISKAALKHWPGIAKVLSDAKVLTLMDTISLRLFCEAYAKYQSSLDMLDESFSELVYVSVTGQLAVRPEWDIHNKAMEQMLKLLKEFGMTPAARANVKVAADGGNPKQPEKGGKFAGIKRKAHGTDA
jgi:P27 family predicted phage terminase small subunit